MADYYFLRSDSVGFGWPPNQKEKKHNTKPMEIKNKNNP